MKLVFSFIFKNQINLPFFVVYIHFPDAKDSSICI